VAFSITSTARGLRFASALGVLTCAAFSITSGSPATAQQGTPDGRLHNFTAVAISPDGSRVVSIETTDPGPDAEREAQASLVIRIIATGARTTIDCPDRVACRLSAPVWSPDGSRIAYLEYVQATGDSAIWTVAPDGSNAKPWISGFKGVLGTPRWSPDGASIAVLATANALKEAGATQAGVALVGDIAAVKVADVRRIAIVGGDGTLRFASPEKLYVYEYDWTPNGRGFAASGAYGNGDDNWWTAKLYTIDATSTTARAIYSPGTQIDAPKVSPDGTTIAFIGGIMSDFGSVGGDVFTIPVDGGTPTDVTPNIPASANALSWAGRNDRILFTALAGDAAALDAVDIATQHVSTLWSAPEVISGNQDLRVSLARDGTTAALVRETFERPPEIFAGPIGKWVALTHENDGLHAAARARSVTWTNDGYRVQGWLLAPLDVVPGKRYPMLVEIHGGPSAAAGPRFVARGTEKSLLERGYFIFYPNPRGSFGQGERYAAANVRDFGYGDLRDVLSGVDAAEKLAPIDDRRLAVGGFSYGGYMAMWTVTQTQRFKAAFAGAGVADWQSYYGQNGIDQWMIPFFGASVYDDPAIYARSSPMTFIKNVKTPTFEFVGERDVECPMAQSLEFWHALHTLGVPTSLVVYAGEGHGIRQPPHRKDITQRTIAWLERYLAP
jgi:dipeptidyl aminopeptidase/acylaminoacyl peptidase